MHEEIYAHSSCVIGHKLYVVGGLLGYAHSGNVKANRYLYFIDIESPQRWDHLHLREFGKRINPVICQIGPESLIISGGEAIDPREPTITYTINTKTSFVSVLDA